MDDPPEDKDWTKIELQEAKSEWKDLKDTVTQLMQELKQKTQTDSTTAGVPAPTGSKTNPEATKAGVPAPSATVASAAETTK